MNKKLTACLLCLFATSSYAQVHTNDNLWFNNGAQVFIGSDALLTVQGDATTNQAGVTGITHLANNGFIWVQGNLYGDNAFQQTGAGVLRLQNKTALYTAPYASENYQVIQGGYRVNGGKATIAASDDGSFYDLELDNQNGLVFIKGNTDVRNSVDFKPASVTIDGNPIAPNGTINRLLTYDPGTGSSPNAAPGNGISYTAIFGMMNSTAGLTNFKNLSSNLTTNTTTLDNAYIQGKLRRALDATSGGSYGFPLGLEPSISSTAARGIQYTKLDITANAYDVVTGYFQQGSNNTDATPASSCSTGGSYTYYGSANHGEWVFSSQAVATQAYNLTIYPQDFGSVSSSNYFITKDNDLPTPGTQSCGTSPIALSVTGLSGFGEFAFAGVKSILNPDINVTHVNVQVSGNMSNNDQLIPGSTYGTPVTVAGNPSTTLPMMNADGTYTFTPPNVGVYVFNVPVCSPDTAIGCVNETLTITVTNPYINNNPPVVNPDVATVDSGSFVNIPVLVNDAPGNPGGSFGLPTLPSPPANGTTSVNSNGTIKYTPNPGFVGIDTFVYNVCDTVPNPDLCKSTTVTVTVNPSGAASNTILANDDFVKIPMNTVASGNVKTNDIDPDGDPMTVTVQNNVTIPGAGVFSVNAAGVYTFTPNIGFFGPVQIPYTICDNMGHCQTATLHVLVDPVNILNPDFNVTNVNVPVNGNMSTNDQLVSGSSFGTLTPVTGNPSTDAPTLNSNGTYSFNTDTAGVYIFNVPVCPPGTTLNCPIETLTITVNNPSINTNPPVANPDVATVDSGQSVNIPVLVNDAPGNPGGSLGLPTPTDPPHGTASVNPDGTIHYTPDPGFTGVDTFRYTVCDTAATPDLCRTTTVTVHVNLPALENTTSAADDYAHTIGTTPVSGNVLTNDIDPEGNSQTITSQNVMNANGTFTLSDDGSYTFTAAAGFTGALSFVYQVCDNGSPIACANATLHILVSPASTALSLDFLTVDAVWSNKDAAVSWEVAKEVNNEYFSIERSFDGQKFEQAGTVKSIGNHVEKAKYSYADKGIKDKTIDKVWYRIKQVGYDGKSTTSDVVMLVNKGRNNGLAYIYPNPVSVNSAITFVYESGEATSGVLDIKILDSHGRIVFNTTMPIVKGRNETSINMSVLATGVYFVEYDNASLNIKGAIRIAKN